MTGRLGWAALSTIVALTQSPAPQTTNDPFPPLEAANGVIAVKFVEFATIPDVNTVAPRMMSFAEDTASKRLFITTMPGRSTASATTETR